MSALQGEEAMKADLLQKQLEMEKIGADEQMARLRLGARPCA
jgi:hypothetical protein